MCKRLVDAHSLPFRSVFMLVVQCLYAGCERVYMMVEVLPFLLEL